VARGKPAVNGVSSDARARFDLLRNPPVPARGASGEPPDMHKHELRRDRLVRPRLQLRMILAFLAVAALALLLQFTLFTSVLSTAAAELPQDGAILLERTSGLTILTLFLSFAVLLPLCLFVGILVTFRVVGPLYRFEKHLETVAEGGDPGPCRIRAGDELQDFCAKLNAALDRVRARGGLGYPTRETVAKPEAA
jgi:hypothetical protein